MFIFTIAICNLYTAQLWRHALRSACNGARVRLRTRPTPNVHRGERRYHVKNKHVQSTIVLWYWRDNVFGFGIPSVVYATRSAWDGTRVTSLSATQTPYSSAAKDVITSKHSLFPITETYTLLYSSPSALLFSSLSPLCRVSTHIFPRQIMSLGNTLLQLFCLVVYGASISCSCVGSLVLLC